MIVLAEQKLADVLLACPNMMSVLPVLNIKPGVSDMSVSEAGSLTRFHSDFFVELVNIIVDSGYKPNCKCHAYNVLPLIDFLYGVFSDLMTRSQLASRLVAQLMATAPDKAQSLAVLQSFMTDFSSEIVLLVSDMHKNLFPVVSCIYDSFYSPSATTTFDCSASAFDEFDHRINEVIEKLDDLLSLVVRHVSGKFDFNVYNSAFRSLVDMRYLLSVGMAVHSGLMRPMVSDMLSAIKRRRR